MQILIFSSRYKCILADLFVHVENDKAIRLCEKRGYIKYYYLAVALAWMSCTNFRWASRQLRSGVTTPCCGLRAYKAIHRSRLTRETVHLL